VSTGSGFKLKLFNKGFVELRNSPGVVADIERRAAAIADAAGEGFAVRPAETNLSFPHGRARVAVVTETFDAMYAEATDRTLTRSIDAGRG